MDKINEERIKQAHPSVRLELYAIIAAANARLQGRAQVRITEVKRSPDRQAELYAQGRTKPGKIVTNAPPGSSYHEYGLAADFVLLIDGKEINWDVAKDYDADGRADWLEVVDEFVKRGWTWGADWDSDGITKAQGDKDEHLVDAPHVQKTFGYGWRELLALRKRGSVDAEGYPLLKGYDI